MRATLKTAELNEAVGRLSGGQLQELVRRLILKTADAFGDQALVRDYYAQLADHVPVNCIDSCKMRDLYVERGRAEHLRR